MGFCVVWDNLDSFKKFVTGAGIAGPLSPGMPTRLPTSSLLRQVMRTMQLMAFRPALAIDPLQPLQLCIR